MLDFIKFAAALAGIIIMVGIPATIIFLVIMSLYKFAFGG